MPELQHYWTRSELADLPRDGNRYEVLDGALLVTPQAAFGHQRVTGEIYLALALYVRPAGIGTVVTPGAVLFGGNELQPDVQVVPGPGIGITWETAPPPILVVEVLSPSTRQRDLGVKLAAYRERLGIPAVWIVDMDERVIQVADSDAPLRAVRDSLVWQPAGAEQPFRLDVPAMFRVALG